MSPSVTFYEYNKDRADDVRETVRYNDKYIIIIDIRIGNMTDPS